MTALGQHSPAKNSMNSHILRDQSEFSLDTEALDTFAMTAMEPHRAGSFDHEHVAVRRPESEAGCSLADATCEQDTPFSEAEVACLVQQVLAGLEFLHSKSIRHGNLNLRNLIIDGESGNIRVLAEDLETRGKTCSGKPLMTRDTMTASSGCFTFQSPEEAHGSKASQNADIWSVGGVTLELLVRGSPQEPAQRATARPALQDAAQGRQPMYPLGLSMECIAFLEDCFEQEPSERASVAELLAHPFIVEGCAEHESESLESELCRSIDSTLVISQALKDSKPTCRPSSVSVLPSKGKAQFSAPSHTERECKYGRCTMCGGRGNGPVFRFTGLAPIVSAQKTVKGGLVVEADGSRSPASAAATKRAAPTTWEDGASSKMEKPSKRLCNQWYEEELEQRMSLSLLGYAT